MAPLVLGWRLFARGIFLVHLTVLSDLETQVLFVVKSLTRHDGFRAESIRNSSLHREEIEQLNGMEHDVYHQKFR